MRKTSKIRKTREVTVKASVNLDGRGKSVISTDISYLDHMLTLLSYHSLIDINLKAEGDLIHHTAEDIAICLGETISKAIGKNSRILRFGSSIVPMDDALAFVSIDLGGRPFCALDFKIDKAGIEDMAGEDIYHFVKSFSDALKANIHARIEYGDNDHHKVEAIFKGIALSLRRCLELDQRRSGSPSSKGVI